MDDEARRYFVYSEYTDPLEVKETPHYFAWPVENGEGNVAACTTWSANKAQLAQMLRQLAAVASLMAGDHALSRVACMGWQTANHLHLKLDLDPRKCFDFLQEDFDVVDRSLHRVFLNATQEEQNASEGTENPLDKLPRILRDGLKRYRSDVLARCALEGGHQHVSFQSSKDSNNLCWLEKNFQEALPEEIKLSSNADCRKAVTIWFYKDDSYYDPKKRFEKDNGLVVAFVDDNVEPGSEERALTLARGASVVNWLCGVLQQEVGTTNTQADCLGGEVRVPLDLHTPHRAVLRADEGFLQQFVEGSKSRA